MSITDSIKKYSLKHVKCPHGAMHTGQVMNMVCVDSSCTHRGLICPICRMENHQTHQILPIKTFLQQIRSMFTQSDNNDELNNLSDYLRALQTAKKQIIHNLRQEVAKLAAEFKSLQQKIQDNFCSVRKNVLIQSSIATKLPSLLTLLTQESGNKDEESIREQFKKYTELLRYENEKLKVSDKAKALVQTYSSIPSKLQSLLSTHSSEFSKKLESLPKLFEQRQKSQPAVQKLASYTFSAENKYYDIILESDNKLAKTEFYQEVGYVFVNENKGVQKQKVILQIVANLSQKISVGFGDAEQFRNACSFINDGTMDQKTDVYEFTYSDGYKKRFNEFDSDSEQEPEGELAGPPFITGDIVEIEYNGKQISYLNRMTQQKITRPVQFSTKTKANVQFVVGLGQNDCVKILDQ